MKPYCLVIYNLIRFTVAKLRQKKFFFHKIELLAPGLKIRAKRSSSICLGERLVSDGRGYFIVDDSGSLHIGNRVYFNDGIMLSCKEHISIGSGCRFGPNVKVFDNDHKFSSTNGVSAEHITGSVEIEDNCWIASNVVILRGTHIGKNCVIGAGCIVKGNIPDGSLVTQSRELTIKTIEDKP